jgi:hypothetical protein
MSDLYLNTAASTMAHLLKTSRASDEGKGEDPYLVGKVNGALEVLSALGLQNEVLDRAFALEVKDE